MRKSVSLSFFILALLSALIFTKTNLFILVSEVDAQIQADWSQDYENGFDGGEPFSLSGSLHSNGCGNRSITDLGGNKVLRAETKVSVCNNNPIRMYRSYHASNQFPLPMLVTFWIYVDADSWQQAAGDRFSQLTIKERGDQGRSYSCVGNICQGGYDDGMQCSRDRDCRNNALIFTTHFRSDGTMDIGHSTMSFRSTTIKAPLRQWNLQSAFIENIGGETHVTTWSDNNEVVRATVDKPFVDGFVRDFHIGMYADREGNGGPFIMYNDNLKFFKVSSKSQALSFINQELSQGPGGTPPTTTLPPNAPTTLPDPDNPSTKFKIGDRIETIATVNVRVSAGEGLYGTHPTGVRGTIIGGPEIGIGGNHWWWDIAFDIQLDGWSREDLLKLVSTVTTSTPPPIRPPPAGNGFPPGWCTCETYVRQECGLGSCSFDEYLHTRICRPAGCNTESICIKDDLCPNSHPNSHTTKFRFI